MAGSIKISVRLLVYKCEGDHVAACLRTYLRKIARSQAARKQANLSVEKDDFELAPFNREGGLGRCIRCLAAN